MESGCSFKLVFRCEPDCQEKKIPSLVIKGEEVRHFRDIPPGWYRINYTAWRGGDEYGVYRLQVENRKGDIFNVWAPSCMGEFLESTQNIIWKYGFYKE